MHWTRVHGIAGSVDVLLTAEGWEIRDQRHLLVFMARSLSADCTSVT